MGATDWIKMRSSLGADPDVIAIAAKLDLDEFGVVGRLHAVWSWLDQHSEDGTNVRIVTAFLDRLTACPGFAEAMRTVNWLTGRDGSLTFPGYAVHNGSTAKSRALETKRKEKQRKGPGKRPKQDGTNTGTNVPDIPGPEERREEKKEPPESPKGDGEADGPRVLPKGWKQMSKADQKRTSVLANSPTMIRIGRWFNRREGTLWTVAEAVALLQVHPTPEDIDLIGDYYEADIDPDADYRRRDLPTLLNNWSGERDRANVWRAGS
jgi:hypothetical protein